MPIDALSGRTQIDAQILLQTRQIGDEVKLKKSSTFKALQWITGIFTIGISAGIMELVHRSKEKSVRASMTRALVDLEEALSGFKPGEEHSVEFRMCGKQVHLSQTTDNHLNATIDNQPVEMRFTAKQLEEQIRSDMFRHGRLFGSDAIQTLMERLAGNDSALRQYALDYLESTVGLTPQEASGVTTDVLKRLVTDSLNDESYDKPQIQAFLAQLSNAYRVNSEETLSLIDKLEQAKTKDARAVSTKVELKFPDQAEKIKARSGRPFRNATADEVRDFAADLVFNKDSWLVDRNMDKEGVIGGQRLRKTLVKHAATIADALRHPELLNTLEPDVRDVISQALQKMADGLRDHGVDINGFGLTAKILVALNQIPDEDLQSMERTIDESVQTICGQLQQRITESFEKVLSSPEDTESVSNQEQTLDERISANARDMKCDGYGKFMKTVMSEYFTRLSPVDQRAVLAAGIRYSDADSSDGAKLGALLKGTGPVMQKMLQGINLTNMDPDFALALRDMKSNLAPIADDVIEAQLLDMVERSEGEITKIEVLRSLGAASVGQALLCKLYSAEHPEGEEVVVKLLRPNVQSYAERENALFLSVAENIPGMTETFKGQMARIREELDLTKEARNIRAGEVYNNVRGDSLKSMAADLRVMPTVSSLVLKKAPGEPLSKYLMDVKNEFAAIQHQYLDEDGVTPIKRDSVNNILNVRHDLNRLYQDLAQRQQHLLKLASAWVTEGIYGGGFYHGDLHSGNIMTAPQGLTVIDFGNATRLTTEQQCEITRMMAAAAVGQTEVFMKGYRSLLSEDGAAKFDAAQDRIRSMLDEVLNMGTQEDSGKRIALALQEIQKLGIEAPGPIFNFSQCQLRLQAAIDEINELLSEVAFTLNSLLACVQNSDGSVFRLPESILFMMRGGFDRATIEEQAQLTRNTIDSDQFLSAIHDVLEEGFDSEHFKEIFSPFFNYGGGVSIAWGILSEELAKPNPDPAILADAKRQLSLGLQQDYLLLIDDMLQNYDDCRRGKSKPSTFCDVMGEVISENLSSSLKRIGLRNIRDFMPV